MNSCILMATIIESPQLRYTQEKNLEMSSMTIELEGLRPEDPTHPLRVIAWGNLAKEVHETYSAGDRVIIEGRLSMNVVGPEGQKEKKAELTAQRIYAVSSARQMTSSHSVASASNDEEPEKVVTTNNYKSKTSDFEPTSASPASSSDSDEMSKMPTPTTSEPSKQDLDEIPF
jgi:single-stranded DNA-binding protein